MAKDKTKQKLILGTTTTTKTKRATTTKNPDLEGESAGLTVVREACWSVELKPQPPCPVYLGQTAPARTGFSVRQNQWTRF